MKVRLPLLVNDPEVAQYRDVPPVDWFTVEGEDVFLDGPVCRRVAVVDFDPQGGALVPGAHLCDGGGVARYDLPPGPPLDPHDPTNAKLRKFARLRSTIDDPARPWIDTWFAG